MPKVEHWFKQDLKDPVNVHSLNGSVFTFDNVGSVIGVEVFDSGNPVALTGTVNGYVILPDDTTISVVGTRSDNKASINLPQSALAIPGFIKIAVKLTNSSEITTMLAVVATVVKSRTDTIITPSQQIITDWSQQIAAEMQAVEDASAAQDVKIAELKNALNGVADTTYIKELSVTWYQGSIGSNGKNNSSNSRCRTDMLPLGEYTSILFKPSTFLFYFAEYSSTNINDFVAITTAVYTQGDYVFTPVKNHYYRIVVKKPDDSVFAPTDPTLGTISLNYIKDLNNTIIDIWESIHILANSDLNDYLTPGRYHSVSTEITETLENCPVSTTGFDLIVTKTSGHNETGDIYVRQILILNAPDSNYFYSRYIGRSYGEWKKLSFTAAILDLIAAEFSTSTNYHIGDYTIRREKYYRFNRNHPAGKWDSSHVDEVTLSDEIQNRFDALRTIAIPANSDLNDYITPGRYHSVNTAITETLENCPVSATGFDLIVTKTSGHNNEGDIYIRQILILNAADSNDFYSRYIGQSYGEWERIAFSSDVQERLNVFSTVAIPANSDLNDYLIPGRYHSVSTTVTKTLSNCPIPTTGFDLIVTKTSGHNQESDIYIRQILIMNGADSNRFYTRYIGQTYGEWQQISFKDDWMHSIHTPNNNPLSARITGNPIKTINVCTFNVAHYRLTNKEYLSELPENLMCLRRYILNNEIDIMFTQEHDEYIDEENEKYSFDWVYKDFFNNDPVNTGEYAGYENKKIFTKLPISTDGTVEYVECYAHPEIADKYSKAYYVWVLQELTGVGTVLLIDVHNFASAQANSANTWKPFESRKKYLDTLSAFMQTKTYDYCIIAGDFNSGNDEGLDSSGKKIPLETNGDFEAILDFCSDNDMHPCNGGSIGWYKTSSQLAYDNILVSNNIRIEAIESDPETRVELYSDHSPIFARITFMSVN